MNEWILKYNEKIFSNYFKYQNAQIYLKQTKKKNDEIK